MGGSDLLSSSVTFLRMAFAFLTAYLVLINEILPAILTSIWYFYLRGNENDQ